MCGASAINDRFVVTAAGCLLDGGDSFLSPGDLRVRPGDRVGLLRGTVPGLEPEKRGGRILHERDVKVEVKKLSPIT